MKLIVENKNNWFLINVKWYKIYVLTYFKNLVYSLGKVKVGKEYYSLEHSLQIYYTLKRGVIMVYLGSDHAGFFLKEEIKKNLTSKGTKFRDFGCFKEEFCDYPDIAKAVCKELYLEDKAMQRQ